MVILRIIPLNGTQTLWSTDGVTAGNSKTSFPLSLNVCGFLTLTSIPFQSLVLQEKRQLKKELEHAFMVLQRWCVLPLNPSQSSMQPLLADFQDYQQGLLPAKPTAPASSSHSPSQPSNQQAPLFMRGCYCWAAFRNKRKLKSLAVQRHPKLREQGVRVRRGAVKEKRKAEIPLIPRWCFPDSSSNSSSAVRVK